MTAVLEDHRLAEFERDGYAAVENIVSSTELERLVGALDDLVHDKERYPEIRRSYVTSGDVSYVGHMHAPHKHHPMFRNLTENRTILSSIEVFLGCRPRLYNSQVMLKGPLEDSHVFRPHQDCFFWRFMPPEVVTCWFAFDDITLDNGCLTVGPGSYRRGLIEHDQYRSALGSEENPERRSDLWKVTDCEMRSTPMADACIGAGGAIFFHGLTIHASRGNRTRGWRRAAGLIYMPERNAHLLSDEQRALGW